MVVDEGMMIIIAGTTHVSVIPETGHEVVHEEMMATNPTMAHVDVIMMMIATLVVVTEDETDMMIGTMMTGEVEIDIAAHATLGADEAVRRAAAAAMPTGNEKLATCS